MHQVNNMNTFNGPFQKACDVCDYRDEKVRNIYPDENPMEEPDEVEDRVELIELILDMLDLADEHGLELEFHFKRPN